MASKTLSAMQLQKRKAELEKELQNVREQEDALRRENLQKDKTELSNLLMRLKEEGASLEDISDCVEPVFGDSDVCNEKKRCNAMNDGSQRICRIVRDAARALTGQEIARMAGLAFSGWNAHYREVVLASGFVEKIGTNLYQASK